MDESDPTRFLYVEPGIYQRGPHFWLRFTLPLPSGGAKRYQLPARWPMRRGVRAANVTEARRFYKLILGHLQGEAAVERRKGGPSVAEVCDAFLKGYRGPKVRDLAAYRADARALLAHVSQHLGRQRAESLSSTDVERLRDALLAEKAPQTTLHVLHRFSKAIDWARKQGILHRSDNPVRGVDKPAGPRTGEPIAPERYLTAPEVSSLLAWSAKHTPSDLPLYATAVYTGMRQGELLRLRWTDVDLDGGRILIRESKSGRSRSVPVSPALKVYLEKWRRWPEHTDDGLVFGEPDGRQRVPLTVRRRLERACGGKVAKSIGRRPRKRAPTVPQLPEWEAKGAGVRKVRFHDLRHTAASLLVSSGVDLLTVARILGHAGVAMTARYSHLGADQLSAAVGKVKLPRARRPRAGRWEATRA
jgi:integrase